MNNGKHGCKQLLPVFCTEYDLNHPVLKQQAVLLDILKSSDEEYTDETISIVLENIFGFHQGNYTKEYLEAGQRTLIGGVVVYNQHRYTGFERTDKDWVEGDMSSDQAKEIYKFGSVL